MSVSTCRRRVAFAVPLLLRAPSQSNGLLSLPPRHRSSQCTLTDTLSRSPLRRYAAVSTGSDNGDDTNDSSSSLPPSSSPTFRLLPRGLIDFAPNHNDRASRTRTARRFQLAKKRRFVTLQEEEARDRQDILFLLLAIAPFILAFIFQPNMSLTLATFLDEFGSVGQNVDGNQFAVNLLRPTITGVVVPVISIALATLVSTTVNVLRERQIELRSLVNKEACELRLLRRAVFGMFGTRQHAGRRARALALLCGYVEQLALETNDGAQDALEELQLRGGISANELEQLSAMLHGVDGAAASRQGSVGYSDDLILSLNRHRSDRVAKLLSVFPDIHWGILIALSLSVCATFLLVSNQQVLQYLNSLQLRLLFAILVGVLSGTATLCADLADPFSGSFSIEKASTQLTDLRVCLEEDVKEACAEAGDISSTTRNFVQMFLGGPSDSIDAGRSKQFAVPEKYIDAFSSGEDSTGGNTNYGSRFAPNAASKKKWRGTSSPKRYGLVSTVYFHLLTGPLGSNVRVLGDVAAWISMVFSKRIRKLLAWSRSRRRRRR